MELLWENRSLLSSGVTSQLMMFVVINLVYGKRERPWVFALTNAMHFVLVNIVMDIFLKEKYGYETWFLIFLPLMGNVLAYAVVIIQTINWKENFVKMLLAFMLADALCGMTGYSMYTFTKRPELIFIFGMCILVIFCLVFSKLMKKYRTIKLYHPWLVGGFILYTTLQGALSRVLYVLQDTNMISSTMFFIGICNIIFAIAFVLVEYIIYTLILQRKYHMLLHNKAQMEDYYRQVSKHIREIDETRILLGQGTKLLAAAHQEQQDSMELSPEELDPKELQTYLSRLKNQYEALGEVFFCNDFAIDSVLRDFVISCRQKGIGTDILFHEYKRGKVAAGDAAAILSRMLDYGQRAAEPLLQSRNTRPGQASQQSAGVCISLHGASVKNQLLFSMTVTVAEPEAWDVDGKQSSGRTVRTLRKIRVKKRSFNPWMRKYNGIIHVQWEGQQMQLVVGLNNGEEQDKRE